MYELANRRIETLMAFISQMMVPILNVKRSRGQMEKFHWLKHFFLKNLINILHRSLYIGAFEIL